LAAALDRVARTHPMLRATLDGDGVVVADEPPVAVDEIEVASLDDGFAAYGSAPFGDSLWRAGLLRARDGRAALALAFDPVVADGASGGIVLRDLVSPGGTAGRTYGEYVAWQAATYAGCAAAGHWHDALDGVAVNRAFPLARDARAEPSGERVTRTVATPPTEDLATRARMTPLAVRVAALLAATARVTGASDLSARVAVAARPRGWERTVGVFANDVVLRMRAAGAAFDAVLAEARGVWLAALAHQHVPYALVRECVSPGLRVDDHRPPEMTVIAPAVGGSSGLATRLAGPAYDDPEGLVVTLDGAGTAATFDTARFDVAVVDAMLAEAVRLVG
jgi:hypothetical protein